MPARVHAILVVRPEGRTPTALHLKRTLDALRAQTRPVDALTIVLCGHDAALTEIAAGSGAEGVITAAHGTGFAAATALATPRLSGDAVWLLAQDTAPEPDALTRLAGALELAPSLAEQSKNTAECNAYTSDQILQASLELPSKTPRHPSDPHLYTSPFPSHPHRRRSHPHYQAQKAYPHRCPRQKHHTARQRACSSFLHQHPLHRH